MSVQIGGGSCVAAVGMAAPDNETNGEKSLFPGNGGHKAGEFKLAGVAGSVVKRSELSLCPVTITKSSETPGSVAVRAGIVVQRE